MGTGNQHKPEGQGHLTPNTPAEAEPPSPERQTSQEESLPSDITTSSASPPDPADLQMLLLEWVLTPDWPTSQHYLQAHPELLTEATEQMLTTFIQIQSNQQSQEFLTLHQQLLKVARQHKVETAYEPLLHREEGLDRAATTEEDLEKQLNAWLQTPDQKPDWEFSQTYLQAHPQLLTDAAEQMLKELKNAQKLEHAWTWGQRSPDIAA